MNDNERYLLDRYRQIGGPGLDYGCGDGRLVSFLAGEGEDFWGAETYYANSEFQEASVGRTGVDAIERIKILGDDFRIPFDDGTFAFVCSNQVIEHVHDLPLTVRELARVSRPGSTGVHIFPVLETVIEPHLGIPFYHRVPRPVRRPLARLWHRARWANFSREDTDFEHWYGELGPFFEASVRLRPASTIARAFAECFEIRSAELTKLSFHRGRSLPALPGLRAVEHRRVGMALETRLLPTS